MDAGDEEDRDRPAREGGVSKQGRDISPPSEQIIIRTMMALAALGVGLRVVHLFSFRSQWVDEIALSENILSDKIDFFLSGPIFHQMAPIGWLLTQRGLARLFSIDPDLLLRFLPFLFSIGALVIFGFLCLRLFSRLIAWMGIAIYATIPTLIMQAGNIKQYSVDEFAGAALILVFLSVLLQKQFNFRQLAGAGAVGMFCVLFSFPSAILMAGLGTTAIISHMLAGRHRNALHVAAICALWLCLFAATYIFIYSHWRVSGSMSQYWDGGFAPIPPGSLADVTWLPLSVLMYIDYLFGQSAGMLLLILLFIGILFFWHRDRLFFFVVAATVVIALILAVEHYPFKTRLLSYAVPLTGLLMTGGLACIYRGGRSGRLATAAILACVLSLSLFESGSRLNAARPFEIEDIKSVLQVVASERRDGDLVYVYYGALPGFWFYRERYGLEDVRFVQGRSAVSGWLYLLEDYANLSGKGRVWFVAAHITDSDHTEVFRDIASRHGEVLSWHTFPGAAVGLVDLPIEGDTEGGNVNAFQFLQPTQPYRAHHPMFAPRLHSDRE